MRAARTLAVLLAAGWAVHSARTIGQDASTDSRSLDEAHAASAAAAVRARTFEAAAARASDAAVRAKAAAAAVGARIEGAQADIDAAQARIAVIEDLRRQQRARLAAKQGAVIRLTAALQTMARRPTSLAIVEPGSIDDAIHVRALLAATAPLVRARTASLRGEVQAGEALRHQADLAVASLRRGQGALERQRSALAGLEVAERMRSARFASSALTETERAEGLGEQARDIIDLMHRDEAAADVAARLVRLPGPIERPIALGGSKVAAGLLRPPLYRLPAEGRIVAGFGETASSGVRARGLSIATAAGAPVVAPIAGRVVYAAPFRGYGRIVIIDHGAGWTTLLTGLGTAAASVGDRLRRGDAIGRAGDRHRLVTVELRRRGEPIDPTPLMFPRRG